MSVRSSTRCVRFTGIALGLLLTAWAPAAAALSAFLTATVHLRAGPSVYYPAVALMPAGTPLDVFGCEEGFDWCDVQAGVDRGWVDATFLSAAAAPGGPPLVIASNAAMLGVPRVTFVFNTYWGNYYAGRPWYGRRNFYYNYWNRWPHGRPPPRPRPPIARPPPPPVRPPPAVRPPPPPGNMRPPGGARPPGNAQPPPGGGSGSKSGSGRPGGRPPDGGRPPGNDRPPPPPRDDQSRPEPRPSS